MIPLILFLAIINALVLIFILVIFNKPGVHPPYRVCLVVFGIVNVVMLGIVGVTGFSVSQFITDWTMVFPHSLESWYVYSIGFLIVFAIIIIPFVFIQLKPLLLTSNRKYFWVGIIFVGIAATIWLPFGFDHAGHWEIWTIRRYLMFGPPSFTADEMVTRVSSRIPHTLAHLMNSDGLQGHFILHFVFFPIKGILIFAILKQFGVDDRFAFFTALLGMLYPSLVPVMSVRLHSQIMRVSIFLLSVYAFMKYMQKSDRFTLLAFFITMYFTVTSVEYPFVLIAMFALFIIFQNRNAIAKAINLLIIWCVVPFAYICYFVLISTHFESYASNQFSISIPDIVLSNIMSLYIHLVFNWSQSLQQDMQAGYVLMAIVLSGCVGFMSYYLRSIRHDSRLKSIAIRRLVIGVAIIICSTLLFSFFPAYSQSLWRIYTYNSIGAALVTVGFVQIIVLATGSSRSSMVFIVVCSILVGLAYNNTIHQYQQSWEFAQNKVDFLKFTQEVDVISKDTPWVFLTEDTSSGFHGDLNPFQIDFVRDDALYVSMSAIGFDHSYVCYLPDNNCHFGASTVNIDSQVGIDYEDVVFFWIGSDLLVELIDIKSDKLSKIGLETDHYHPSDFVVAKPQSS